MRLQEGIGWTSRHQPGDFFALICLRRTAVETAPAAAALSGLWERYRLLRGGELPDLPGQRVPPGGLQVLVGYGPRALAGHRNPDIGAELRECAFVAPGPDRGVLPGAALRYAPDVTGNPGDADVVIQLTAQTPTAVNRAVVETDRHLAEGAAALEVSGVYLGTRRDDGRSWIGFYDGVDNIDSSERLNAVQIGPAADERWLRGGTYLAFLRIAVDVAAWDRLPVDRQELLIGRDKATGVPLGASAGALLRPPLAPGTTSVLAGANVALREPPLVDLDDPTGLGASHVQRARRHPNMRVFRQGYDFLEVLDAPPRRRVGLNFASFQAAPLPLMVALRTDSWLGGAMAGDDAGGTDVFQVRAAGMYAVPPAVDAGVPGLSDVWP